MKILFVTDLHYALKQFDWLTANVSGHDAVIIGGDLLDLSGALDIEVQSVVVEKYLNRLRQDTTVLVCSGNHDGDERNSAGESTARWLKDSRAAGLHVDGDSVDLGSTRITICPWWDGPVSREELAAQLEHARPESGMRWIWIHHAPPDKSKVSWTGKRFGGDVYLVEWIHRFAPDYVLSGHIHNAPFYPDGSWVDRVGETWVFNPGRQIGPSPATLSIDVEAGVVEWNSLAGAEIRELTLRPLTLKDAEPSSVAGA
jgi:Icc-related predicted phosphoesterase